MCSAQTRSKTERTHILYQFSLTKVYFQIRKFVYQYSFAYGFSKLLSEATYDLSFVQLEYFKRNIVVLFIRFRAAVVRRAHFSWIFNLKNWDAIMKFFVLLFFGLALGIEIGTAEYNNGEVNLIHKYQYFWDIKPPILFSELGPNLVKTLLLDQLKVCVFFQLLKLKKIG